MRQPYQPFVPMILTLAWLLGVAGMAQADVLETIDGVVLQGRIRSLSAGRVTIETATQTARIDIGQIKQFRVEPSEDPSSSGLGTLYGNQRHILSRLEQLEQAIQRLETGLLQLQNLPTNTTPAEQSDLFSSNLAPLPITVHPPQVYRQGEHLVVQGLLLNSTGRSYSQVAVQITLRGWRDRFRAEPVELRQEVPIQPMQLLPGQTANYQAVFSGVMVVDTYDIQPVGWVGEQGNAPSDLPPYSSYPSY